MLLHNLMGGQDKWYKYNMGCGSGKTIKKVLYNFEHSLIISVPSVIPENTPFLAVFIIHIKAEDWGNIWSKGCSNINIALQNLGITLDDVTVVTFYPSTNKVFLNFIKYMATVFGLKDKLTIQANYCWNLGHKNQHIRIYYLRNFDVSAQLHLFFVFNLRNTFRGQSL